MWTVLAAAALAVAYAFLVGIIIGLVIVFFDRKSRAAAKSLGRTDRTLGTTVHLIA